MIREDTPLYTALGRHVHARPVSFHTPGHKGRLKLWEEPDWSALDLTELSDTGSLYDGGDCIEASEKLAEQAFGTGLTLYSAGGCTLCIQTMLKLAADYVGGPHPKVLMARNAHRSAVHAAALLDLDIQWVWPPQGLGTQPAVENFDEKLKGCPDIRIVYVTSPDYTGKLLDISRLSRCCRRHGALLLVDNAHGSHLKAFGCHPLELGADMTADSCHKTLPAMTGGAMLHVSKRLMQTLAEEGRAITRFSAKAAMSVFGSTSPSYPVLASLDLVQAWWRQRGPEEYRGLLEAVEGLKTGCRRRGIPYESGSLQDPVRLTLLTSAVGISGRAAARWMEGRGLYPEHSDEDRVILILTPFNTPEDWERLERAIGELPEAARTVLKAPESFSPFTGEVPDKQCSPAQALRCRWEEIPAAEAAGRICASCICPCPPGIAVAVPGEILSSRLVRQLEDWKIPNVLVLEERKG